MSDLDPETISLFELGLSLPADAPNVLAEPHVLANLMWEYGEEDLEAQINRRLTLEQWQGIALEAGRLSVEEDVTVQAALSRAVVSVLEGYPRPLARTHRRTRPA